MKNSRVRKLILSGLGGFAALAIVTAALASSAGAAPIGPTLKPFCATGPIRCQSALRLDIPIVAQAQAAWAPNTAYAIGALVTYGGHTYKCLQAHTSQTGWEPPNVPALWQLLA